MPHVGLRKAESASFVWTPVKSRPNQRVHLVILGIGVESGNESNPEELMVGEQQVGTTMRQIVVSGTWMFLLVEFEGLQNRLLRVGTGCPSIVLLLIRPRQGLGHRNRVLTRSFVRGYEDAGIFKARVSHKWHS